MSLSLIFKGIDFECFASLSEKQIEQAIPDLIPRFNFENKYKKFRETIDITSAVATAIENDSMILDANTPSTSSRDTYNETIFDKDFDLYNSVTGPVMVSKTVLSSRKADRKVAAIKNIQDIIDIKSIELKIVIMKCIEKKQPVENNDRVTIGKEIVHHLLVDDLERMITRPEFLKLAKLVVQLFPNELEGTYYIPSVNSSPPQGKLYTAFANYRSQLKAVGLIQKKDKQATDDNDEGLEIERAQLEEKSDALKFVLEEANDFDRIKTCWQACFNERQKLLNEFSSFEYMRRFPSFDLPSGYELLMLDADTLFVNTKSILLDIAPRIIAYAYPKKKATLETKSLIAAYEELIVDLETDSIEFQTVQQLIAIRLLPHVTPNPKKKLSRSEIDRVFCPYFKTALAADNHNSNLNKDYKDDVLILKPRLYFHGAVSRPCATIWIANKKYSIEDPIIGFDILFKSFLGLKCQYPDETKHIWQFVQKVVYGIEISGGKKNAGLDAFIHDIETINI